MKNNCSYTKQYRLLYFYCDRYKKMLLGEWYVQSISIEIFVVLFQNIPTYFLSRVLF